MNVSPGVILSVEPRTRDAIEGKKPSLREERRSWHGPSPAFGTLSPQAGRGVINLALRKLYGPSPRYGEKVPQADEGLGPRAKIPHEHRDLLSGRGDGEGSVADAQCPLRRRRIPRRLRGSE